MEVKIMCHLVFFVILSVVIYPCVNINLHYAQKNRRCLVSNKGNVSHKLTEWYDDECHRFRCEINDGKEEIVVTSCKKPLYPENAIHCKATNLDNKEEEYPRCCPRLKCLVVVKSDKFVQDVGQPEEIFGKTSLTSNQEIIDNYDDFDYHAMSARHQASEDSPNIHVRTPEVISNKDYAEIFEDESESDQMLGRAIKRLPKPPKQYYIWPKGYFNNRRPKTFLEWVLWPLRGMFTSRMEVLGVSRFSLNSSKVWSKWHWTGRDTYFIVH